VALDFEDYLVNPGDVVVFARASDNRLWYREHVFRQLNPPQWTWNQWEMVPGSFNDLAGAPAVVSRYAYCYDVVYRTDAGKIVLREYTYANGWSGETILDQFGLDSDPAIASWDQARLDVFLEHPDGTIWHTYWASPKPKIIDVFPRSIMAGSINTTITITGNNFYPNSEVKIDVPDSQPLLITKYINEHTLTAVVPTSWLTTSGSFPIYVDVPGTTQTNFHSADYTITVTMKSNLPIAKIGLTNGQTWYLDSNGNGTFDAGDKVNGFGLPGWTPVVGDWQGTGISSIGVYKDGAWYLDTNGDGAFNAGDSVCSFGLAGWTPIVGDWNGNGKTKIGVTNGQTWYLDTNGDGIFNAGDNVYSFGAPGWTPVIGKWS
jgi:hypothetical protein